MAPAARSIIRAKLAVVNSKSRIEQRQTCACAFIVSRRNDR